MRWFFAACDVLTAILVLIALFVGVPVRWLPVDAVGCLVAGAYVVTAIAIVRRRDPIVKIAAGIVLAIGLALVALLAISASHLMGIYGPIGKGNALLLLLVAALVIPYLVALPAAQIVWKR